MNHELKDLFLCYNKADKDWTHTLAERIEAETIDGLVSSRNLTVFFAEWDVDYGENIINRINAALPHARYFAPVMSPEFFKSGWTNFEWTDVAAEDPAGLKKKLIPLLLRDVSLDDQERLVLPAPFKALRHLDFREKSKFEEEFQKLLRRIRGLPPQRGAALPSKYGIADAPEVSAQEAESWLPERVRDALLGNLLEVSSFPPLVWSAPTEKKNSRDVRAAVSEAEGHIIRGNLLYTFANLSDKLCQLRKVVKVAHVQKQATREWLLDPTKASEWITLLNQALTSHLSKLAIRKEEKGRYFFRPNKDGTTRTWRNGRDRPREVAAKKINPADGTAFWVHHAARIRFKRLGDRFFLMIEPTYFFTTEGETPFAGQKMGRMVIMWAGRQKNADILRNFVFWAKTIAKGNRQLHIETGAEPIIVSGVPALAVANVGIASDHIRIGSLLAIADQELDEVAKDVEVVPAEDVHEQQSDEPEEE
jgi:TIR domain-containing protein